MSVGGLPELPTSPKAPRPMRSPRVHSRGGADASAAARRASSACSRALSASGGLRPEHSGTLRCVSWRSGLHIYFSIVSEGPSVQR